METSIIEGLDSILGTHVGTAFCTFIGNLYMDFGPIGTLLIAIVVSAIFSRKIYIKDLADAYIMCFYFQFIMDGVLYMEEVIISNGLSQ